MLTLKPNCEVCDIELPPDSRQAYICSYECTFCQSCVEEKLNNVCPNCGGGFSARPIRPKKAYREGVSVEFHPPSTERVHTPYSEQALSEFRQQIESIPFYKR